MLGHIDFIDSPIFGLYVEVDIQDASPVSLSLALMHRPPLCSLPLHQPLP